MDLSFNGIGDKGLETILKAVSRAPELTTLDISNNGITDVGCGHIAKYLKGEYCVPHSLVPPPPKKGGRFKETDALQETIGETVRYTTNNLILES